MAELTPVNVTALPGTSMPAVAFPPEAVESL